MVIANALLARQGIYDSESTVKAYEVLYRCNEVMALENSSEEENDKASASVISQLFSNLDFNRILNEKQAYINFTKNHIMQNVPDILPKRRVVIELLENIEVDSAFVETVKGFHKRGFTFALDDFVYSESWEPLLDYASIIKVDVLNLSPAQIKDAIQPLSGFKGKLLAEKIEDYDTLMACQDMGFVLFQGYYLDKPNLIRAAGISDDKMQMIRLINQLQDPVCGLNDIASTIMLQPKLSYRILRFANSAAFYSGRKYETLIDVINQLGLQQIRNWASLLLLAIFDEVNEDLLERTLIRARCAELLASQVVKVNPQIAYTLGMFSTLDAMFNEPMDALLQKVQLSDEIKSALLSRKGPLGQLLTIVIDLEKGHFDNILKCKVPTDILTKTYVDSIHYAKSTLQELYAT